jgi:hypothetical protein
MSVVAMISREWTDKLAMFSAWDRDVQRIEGRLKELAEKTVRGEIGDVEVRVMFVDDIFGRSLFESGCERMDSLLRGVFQARYDWLEATEYDAKEEKEGVEGFQRYEW